MAGTIKLKRSAVTGRKPGVNDMAVGELALNTFDGKAYLRGNNGADFVREIGVMDDSGNLPVNSLLRSIQSVASSNGVTALTNASNEIIQVTGTLAHTLKLPDATTLKAGRSFTVLNRSTGTVTVQDGSGAALGTVGRGLSASLRATGIGSAAGTWDLDAGGGAASSSGSGQKNYLANPNGYTGTAGWSNFTATLTNGVPTSAPTIQNNSITLSAVTTNVLSGVSSLQIAGPGGAAITVGDGIISDAFTVDNKDLAKMLSVLFDYQVLAGGNGSNLAVYLYNVGAAQWVQPSNYKPFNAINVSSTSPINFQTDYRNTTNFNQYRLAVVAVAAGSAGFSMNFQASVGSQAQLTGAPVTDLTAFALTGSWTTGATYIGKVARLANIAYIEATVAVTGAVTNSTLHLFLPASLTIDTAAQTDSTVFGQVVGHGGSFKTGGRNFQVLYVGPRELSIVYQSDLGGLQTEVAPTLPATWAAGDKINVTFTVPILGWGSSVTMSSNDDGRIIACQARVLSNSGTLPASAFSKLPFNAVAYDTTGSFDATNNRYIVPVSGYYNIDVWAVMSCSVAGAETIVAIVVNNTDTYGISNNVVKGAYCRSSGSRQLKLNAGDTVHIQGYADNATFSLIGALYNDHNQSGFEISRISNSSVIAASERVAARYGSTSGQSLTNATFTVLLYNSKVDDSHGAYNSQTGIWTAPRPGRVQISAKMTLNTTSFPASTYDHALIIYVRQNGVEVSSNSIRCFNGQGFPQVSLNDTIPVNAGDQISIVANQTNSSASAIGLFSGANYSSVSFLMS